MINVIVRKASYDYEQLRPVFFEIIEALAGDKIKTGARVLIKPNMLSAASPRDAVLTHPLVIRAAAEYVLQKGAVPQVCDSPAIGSFDRILKQNGALDALAGLDVLCLPFKATRKVNIGKPYGEIDIARDALNADLIINLPKLKTHTQMLLTLGVKNMFGCIVGFQKPQWHLRAGVDKMAFARLLVAIHQAVKPTVSVLDGILAMEGEGPGKGGKPREIGVLMGSCNTFALDMAVCRMIGINPERVPVLKAAREDNLLEPWTLDGALPAVPDFALPDSAEIVFGPRIFQNFLRRHTLALPVGDDRLCRFCGQCRTICPAQAIKLPDEKRIEFDYEKCIRCYCCIEVCPHGVLRAKETAGGRLMRYLTDKFS
jgi:uncharacterized protein (DUF362 family)/Pyruvate/2-oxoacid:ferredoxin oxidoreductase delta subunit